MFLKTEFSIATATFFRVKILHIFTLKVAVAIENSVFKNKLENI